MAVANQTKPAPTERAMQWRRAFKEQDPAKRLRKISQISYQYSSAIEGAGQNKRLQLWKDMVHAAGDRSTAKKVIRVAEFPAALIAKAEAHLASEGMGSLNGSIDKPDKRGTRAAEPVRVRRASGFSVTHLLTLTLIDNFDARQKTFNKCIEEKWPIDDLRKYVKQSGQGKKNAPKARPTQLTFATHKQASELNDLLVTLSKMELPQAANAIKKLDRSAARQNCIDAIEKLSEVQLNLEKAVESLRELKEILATDSDEVQDKSGNGRSGAKKK
jgi:hypothetical protein